MLAPFEASNLKIARARKHLQELKSEIAAFFSKNPYRLVIEPWELNSQTGFVSHSWVVHIDDTLPSITSTIIGDVFHNLRTSLDILVCDLVRIEGKSVKEVLFPFCETPNEFAEAVKVGP